MKKLSLLLTFAITAFVANAQLILSGASPYTQNFDAISSTLPTGWVCYSAATSSSFGTIYAYTGDTKFGVWADSTTGLPASCTYCADIRGVGFKNSASADVANASDTGGTQRAYSNRALAVKQTSSIGWDPGPAFVLHLKNTLGCTGLGVNFKLQSLDNTDPRVTSWTVDYGIGASPTTFTTVATTGDNTTGGYTFKNSAVSASFGSALNNNASEIWIRIASLSASTASGARTTTGIDDFNLTWTGTAGPSAINNVSSQPALALTVLGNTSRSQVVLEYSAEETGNYNFAIYDIAGRVLHHENITAAPGVQKITVNGLSLAPGMYFAKMNNSNSSSVAKIMIR